MTPTKICQGKCGEEKSIFFFYKDYHEKDNRKPSCIKCYNKAKKKDAARIRSNNLQNIRRKPGKGIHLVLYKRRSATKTAEKVYNAENIPLFMQYNHLIYKYVRIKYDLSASELNLLLFVYPLCPFSRKDFSECRDIMMYKANPLGKFKRDDLVYLWKKWSKININPDLFDFTYKGKKLIRDIHYYALGKEKIPECDSSINILARIKATL